MDGISVLKGQTLVSVNKNGDEEILFETSSGDKYRMYHYQECCESVYIEDVCGDLEDLVGNEILTAECRSEDGNPQGEDRYDDSSTWTFYELATIKGSVTIRWYGTSNGYYSQSAHFEKVS